MHDPDPKAAQKRTDAFVRARNKAQAREEPAPQARPEGPADAVMIHTSMSKRSDIQGHSIEMDAAVRKVMKLAPSVVGPRLWASTQDNVWKFFRRDPAEELLFPDGHPLAKQPRYYWYQETPLIMVGYLKPEAVEEMQDRANLGPFQPSTPGGVAIEPSVESESEESAE